MAEATNKYEGNAFPGNFNLGKAGMPNEVVKTVRYFDCTARTLAQASHKVCSIPANSLVWIEVIPLAASTATATYAWGDKTTANIFKAAAALAANVRQMSTGAQYYTADDEVQFTVATADDVAGKFFVIVHIMAVPKVAV